MNKVALVVDGESKMSIPGIINLLDLLFSPMLLKISAVVSVFVQRRRLIWCYENFSIQLDRLCTHSSCTALTKKLFAPSLIGPHLLHGAVFRLL